MNNHVELVLRTRYFIREIDQLLEQNTTESNKAYWRSLRNTAMDTHDNAMKHITPRLEKQLLLEFLKGTLDE